MTVISKIRLRFQQLYKLIKLSITWIISLFIKDKDLWLISERGKEARDNAYFLFIWLKQNHPEINAKYIISKDSHDLSKLEKWSNDIVYYKTLNHYIRIWKAKYLISTHIMGYTPDAGFFTRFDRIFNIFRNKKKIFLQHGVLWFIIEPLFHKYNNLDLFICGSQKEYEVVRSFYGYPKGVVQYTGLCRFDNLHNNSTKKQILVMPTWRMYIDRNHFEQSEYFAVYKDLLCSVQLSNMLEKYGYNLVFYPHYEFQSKIHLFKELNTGSNISIADMGYDVQSLLKESKILITDFSSVFFDMMYMSKSILFYQFDQEKHSSSHYKNSLQTSYFDLNKIGNVVITHNELLLALESLLENKKGKSKTEQNYVSETFRLKDTNNCKRVFEAIIKC